MSEIVKRLRTTRLLSQNIQMKLQNEAADEIERLQAALDLIPDDIELYRIMKAAGRSRREYMVALNTALEPVRAVLSDQA